MRTINFEWILSHSSELGGEEKEKIPATVPGAAGLDYARAKNYPPYYFAKNYENFLWMENEYFTYETVLDFSAKTGEFAKLCFDGIDYEYDIVAGSELLLHSEGMFSPICIDVTRFSGKKTPLKVVIYPIPKMPGARRPGTRDEAAACCKPASSYGWDWHPRLVPSGIWKDVRLEIHGAAPVKIDASYRLNDALDTAKIHTEIDPVGTSDMEISLIAPDGSIAYERSVRFADGESVKLDFELSSPRLWYPRGYGEQPIYTLVAKTEEKTVYRKIGFRRVKLLRNFDDTNPAEKSFPKSRYPAPATIEVNGVKVFAKGSNWVNTEIFPCLMTKERYDELLTLVENANMNILRMWGGGFINHDCFYDMCDERGIMLWQEFMLSCNKHPDSDKYLSVLNREATYIIKNLRTHPALTLWCGGNELFNSWSGLTDQSHPLRMLNSLCYELDRFTPFNATSPLEGMGHGTYNTLFTKKAASADTAGLGGNIACDINEEFITVLTNSYFTAYTEFGSSGCADPKYIKKYIMEEKDYLDFGKNNPMWVAHHAFCAWSEDAWSRPCEIDYYFGGYTDVDDFMHKSLEIQAISYKSLFEEMRRQWPHCSMAINWDFNEPWPCAAGNSLVNWPCHVKPAYYAVSEALRPTVASIRTGKNRFVTGEKLSAELWILNDSATEMPATRVKIYVDNGKEKSLVAERELPSCPPRANKKAELGFCVDVTDELGQYFYVSIECDAHPEINSTYKLIHRK